MRLFPGRLFALVLAALTCVLSVVIPLAPTTVSTPTVSWPQAGAPATSTVALFMPYRPLDVTAQVPCAAVGALAGRAASGVLVATAEAASSRGEQRSLAVGVADGQLTVRSAGTDLTTLPVSDPRLAAAGCVLTVTADQAGTTVDLDGQRLASRPGLRVPEVTAFVTDTTAADGGAPSVVAHPDARFESSPTPLKVAVLLAHALLALASLLVLLLLAGPVRRGDTGPRGARPARLDPAAPRWWRRLASGVSDAAVVVGLVGWAGVGPLHTDDFYYVLEARSASALGYVGNVVRYFDVPEIPFTLQQTVLSAVATVSVSPWAMRLPAAVFGVGSWLLLTRLVLPRLVEDPPVWTRPLGAVVLLAWWWPFDVSARPESLVVLLSTATLALVLEAVGRRRVALLGVAALAAGTAVAVTASGLLAAALLLVLAPRWWPVLRESRLGALATGGLLLACASVASPLVFADAGLATALTALRVHDEVGPNLAWWEEAQRYSYLLVGPDPNQRDYARQVVVLVTIVLLVGITTALLRARSTTARRVSWVVPVTAAVVGFAVLTVSPTKWSHHFGALAGVGTLLAVVGAVVLVRRRPSRWSAIALWAVVVVVAGVGFHGPDAQVEYSAYGVTPDLPSVLGSPLLWAALSGVLVLAVLRGVRRRHGDAWPELAVSAVVVVLAGSVVVQAASVATAAYRLRGSWSVASDAAAQLTGSSCGFPDAAVALTGQEVLAPAPGAGGGAPAPADDVPALLPTAPAGVGVFSGVAGQEVVTPWRALGGRSASDTLALDVLGSPAAVTVEFADAAGAPLPVPALVPEAPAGTWQRIGFGPVADAPAGAVQVRVRLRVAADSPDPAAVTDVYRRTGQTVSDVVPAGTHVLIDWPIGLHFPCYAPPVVAGGMVEPVGWFVQSATFENTPPLTIIDGGGAYATLPEVATLTRYRGFLPGTAYREWGNLVRLDYDLPVGRYDVSAGSREVPGWRWWDGAGPGPSPDGIGADGSS